MRAPASLLAIPLIVGCGCGLAIGESLSATFAFAAAAAALIALIGAVGALTFEEVCSQANVCLVIGALVVGLSLGVDGSIRAYRAPLYVWFTSHRPSGPVLLEGTLREDASISITGVSVAVDVDAITSPTSNGQLRLTRGAVRLTVIGTLANAAMGDWRSGRRVRVAATLREPTVYRNPGVPDDQRILARRGTSLVGSVKSAAMVEVVARGTWIDEWAGAFRSSVRYVLSDAVGVWSPRSAAVAVAILIGDRTGLAQADEERLQAAGTYHVIAISGGNIAILTVLLLVIGRACGLSTRTTCAWSIVVLLAYGRITGPAPSVDRAIAAAVLFLAGRLLELRGGSINILAIAAALGVSWSPASIADPGFLLSFGATLGILVGVPRFNVITALTTGPTEATQSSTSVRKRSSARGRRTAAALILAVGRQFVVGALTMMAATAAAEIALAPIGAALFGRVTGAGLILNLAAIPLMTVVQAASLTALAVWPLHQWAGRLTGYIVHLAATGLVDSARLVDLAPWISHEVAPPGWALVAAYYVALLVALRLTTATGRLARACCRTSAGVALLAGIVILTGPHRTSRGAVPLPGANQVRVVFLDVGQGDATLVLLPDGKSLLIDAGGLPVAPLQDPAEGLRFDIGERVVGRALRAFGVRSLDTFVITHGDPDHIGGADAAMRSFRPRAIWEGVPVPPHEPLRRLADAAAELRAEWRSVQAGDRLRISGAEIDVLHPPPPEWERQRVRNDDSVVLAIRFGDVEIVLPGDIGREGESLARTRFSAAPLTILKAPHHGSATSSTQEFLDAIRPAAVIVSAGRNNRFNHPAPVVVARYRRMHVQMFSTAQDGAVVVDTDGRSVQIWTWGGRGIALNTNSSR